MEREEVIDQILYARTVEEIDAAEEVALRWLNRYPDDVGVAMACEQLAMMRGAIEMTKGEK